MYKYDLDVAQRRCVFTQFQDSEYKKKKKVLIRIPISHPRLPPPVSTYIFTSLSFVWFFFFLKIIIISTHDVTHTLSPTLSPTPTQRVKNSSHNCHQQQQQQAKKDKNFNQKNVRGDL